MSATKFCSLLVCVSVSCVTALVLACPVEQIPGQTAARAQGSPVIFFVTHQGQLREVLFNPIIFNQVLVNQGSAYDNNTGVFTAPVAGIYQFVFGAQLCRGNFNNLWYFMVNREQRMLCHAQVSGGDTTFNSCYLMDQLKKGDQVWIKQNAESCAWASTNSNTITLSGVLLSSEGRSMLGGKYVSSRPLPGLHGHGNTVYSSADWRVAASDAAITLLLWCLLLE